MNRAHTDPMKGADGCSLSPWERAGVRGISLRLISTSSAARTRRPSGFTLLEVTIAMALFFMATFAILGLVSNTLRNARALQETEVDASMLASELSATNKLYETTDSGDFGNAYRDYSWTRDIHSVGTNGLFEVDFVVHHRLGRKNADTAMSVLFFRPLSPTDRFGPTLR
jgi:type II secretion system protein I